MKEDLKKFDRLKCSRVRKFGGSKDFKQIRMFSNDFKQRTTNKKHG